MNKLEQEDSDNFGEELINFFNSPKREKLLKEVARKSNEDQKCAYDKAYEDELYFGQPISNKEFSAYLIAGILAMLSPFVIAYLLVTYFFKV